MLKEIRKIKSLVVLSQVGIMIGLIIVLILCTTIQSKPPTYSLSKELNYYDSTYVMFIFLKIFLCIFSFMVAIIGCTLINLAGKSAENSVLTRYKIEQPQPLDNLPKTIVTPANCPVCNFKNDPGAAFCGNCGYKLG